MNGTWTVLRSDRKCGGCTFTVPARTALLLVLGKLVRCPACAEGMGWPVDQVAVDHALHALEAEDARRHAPREVAMSAPARNFTSIAEIMKRAHVPVQHRKKWRTWPYREADRPEIKDGKRLASGE